MERNPRPGAIVISRDESGVFALCDNGGVPQIVCDTFQELLHLAVHFTQAINGDFDACAAALTALVALGLAEHDADGQYSALAASI